MEGLDDWPARALADTGLAADAVLSLRHASWPVDSTRSPAAMMDLPPAWVCHVRWPRRRRTRRIGVNKDAASSRRRIGDNKDATASRQQPSPMTPMEYCGGSGASQSGSEGIYANRCNIKGPACVTRHQTKVVVSGEREPSVFRIADPRLISRSLIKKKPTHPELQAMHQSLLEHRGFLQKELKAQRMTKVALVVKNQEWKRLKLRLELQKRSSTALPVSEQTHPKRLRLCDSFAPLPDLNIPLVGEWD